MTKSMTNQIRFLLLLLPSVVVLTTAACFSPDLSNSRLWCESTDTAPCPGSQQCIRGCCGGPPCGRRVDLAFDAKVVTTCTFPDRLAAADFDQDGFSDVTVACSGVGAAVAFYGSPTGLSTSAVLPLLWPSSKTVELVTVDFDGNGLFDILEASAQNAAVGVLINNGKRSFRQGGVYKSTTGVYTAIAGDWDNDGNTDIALVDGAATSTLQLLYLQQGSVKTTKSIVLGSNTDALVAAHLDADGKLDFATANYTSNDISVVLANSNKGVQYSSSAKQNGIVSSDVNRDGFVDIITSDGNGNAVNILTGLGDGRLGTKLSYPVGKAPVGLLACDLDSDGVSEIVTVDSGSNTVTILTGALGSFKSITLLTGKSPNFAACGDFDHNGVIDLVVTNSLDNSLTMFLGK